MEDAENAAYVTVIALLGEKRQPEEKRGVPSVAS
jgi:hypothetical protein